MMTKMAITKSRFKRYQIEVQTLRHKHTDNAIEQKTKASKR